MQHNLIFVERDEGLTDCSISNTYTSIDGVQIPITLIRTDDFIPIFESIDENKRKIPARILRYCKEQLYNLVQSNEPEKKICVVDIDEVEKHADVEFIVGVGVAEAKRKEIEVGSCGYTQISSIDLFDDLLHDNKKYDPNAIIGSVIPSAGRYSPNIVVFKYLSTIGIKNQKEYLDSGLPLDKWVNRTAISYQSSNYLRAFVKKFKDKDTSYIINHSTPESAAIYLPFLWDKLELDVAKEFLIQHQEKLNNENSSYSSYFRKLACLYDRLTHGW